FEESKMKLPSLQGRCFHVVMAMISIISAFDVLTLGKETKGTELTQYKCSIYENPSITGFFFFLPNSLR
ncbi:MAG TPA: hypothetical protein ENG66_07520, partial [Thermococcus sp.]|nr:hypothetical protein [Thermococcus sp.]